MLNDLNDNLTLTANPSEIAEGGIVVLRLTLEDEQRVKWIYDEGRLEFDEARDATGALVARWDTTGLRPSSYRISAQVGGDDGDELDTQIVVTPRPLSRDDILPVTMRRSYQELTVDQVLWTVIRNRTEAISFDRFDTFITGVMCNNTADGRPVKVPFTDVEAYNLLKVAAEEFLMHEVGVIDPEAAFGELEAAEGDAGERARLALRDESSRMGRVATVPELRRLRDEYYEDLLGVRDDGRNRVLPYLALIRNRLREVPIKDGSELAAPDCYGISYQRITGPLALELIWSYWMEEGGLVQAINAVAARFQNRRIPGHAQLSRLDLDPLRALSNLFWGYVQDEQHRLGIARRTYEYDHHYGLRLVGKAVPQLAPADSRSRFVEAFHALLNRCAEFYPQDDDTTVIADGFPVLNALREVHMLLAEGAHNQFGDLPSTARVEMLIQQWLLARPEMRDFLGGRLMVPYAERWMDRVDVVRGMLGFGDTSVTHFRDLAVYGEQILLTVRYANWSRVNNAAQAANWARYWRPEIQRYIHAYRAVTGVDLVAEVDATRPSQYLAERAAAR
jgi:hypothetical protein